MRLISWTLRSGSEQLYYLCLYFSTASLCHTALFVPISLNSNGVPFCSIFAFIFHGLGCAGICVYQLWGCAMLKYFCPHVSIVRLCHATVFMPIFLNWGCAKLQYLCLCLSTVRVCHASVFVPVSVNCEGVPCFSICAYIYQLWGCAMLHYLSLYLSTVRVCHATVFVPISLNCECIPCRATYFGHIYLSQLWDGAILQYCV